MAKNTNYAAVDQLGRVKAQLAELKKQEEKLRAEVAAMGAGSYEGALFRATVGEDGEATQYDNEAIREKLIALGHRRFVNAHCERVPKAGAVRVVAKTGEGCAKQRAA